MAMMSSTHAGLDLAAGLAHARRFHLEQADVLRAAHQLVGGGIVERDFQRRHFLARGLLDQLQRVLDDGQRFQAEEIHLEQAEFAERLHRVLRDDAVVIVQRQRHVIGQVVVGNDHARGMHAGLARDALERQRGIDHRRARFPPRRRRA